MGVYSLRAVQAMFDVTKIIILCTQRMFKRKRNFFGITNEITSKLYTLLYGEKI